jgi:mono/diheme cytochrome c family protein
VFVSGFARHKHTPTLLFEMIHPNDIQRKMEKTMKILHWNKLFAFLAVVVLSALLLAACSSSPAEEAAPKPSNSGGAGPAVNLTGDATKGAAIFKTNCISCHGDQGKAGVPNPGSKDGTVPNLNPLEDSFMNADAKVYATNLDLFIEHGSTPEGTTPALKMAAFGDQKTLQPQDIADVIAYIISLNKK